MIIFCIYHYTDLTKTCIKTFRYVRKLVDSCKESPINGLSLVNWDKLLNETDEDEAYNIFVNTATQVYDKNCPIKRICFNTTMTKNKPWVTRGLQNACKKKNNIYKQFLKLKPKEA